MSDHNHLPNEEDIINSKTSMEKMSSAITPARSNVTATSSSNNINNENNNDITVRPTNSYIHANLAKRMELLEQRFTSPQQQPQDPFPNQSDSRSNSGSHFERSNHLSFHDNSRHSHSVGFPSSSRRSSGNNNNSNNNSRSSNKSAPSQSSSSIVSGSNAATRIISNSLTHNNKITNRENNFSSVEHSRDQSMSSVSRLSGQGVPASGGPPALQSYSRSLEEVNKAVEIQIQKATASKENNKPSSRKQSYPQKKEETVYHQNHAVPASGAATGGSTLSTSRKRNRASSAEQNGGNVTAMMNQTTNSKQGLITSMITSPTNRQNSSSSNHSKTDSLLAAAQSQQRTASGGHNKRGNGSKQRRLDSFISSFGKKSNGKAPAKRHNAAGSTTSLPVINSPRVMKQVFEEGDANAKITHSEMERLRERCDDLVKQCIDKEEQLKAVSNNRTIMHSSLKTELLRKEKEIAEMKDSFLQKSSQSRKAIEDMLRENAAKEFKESRQKLASDGARLGRLTYSRAGLRTVETWEHGYAMNALKVEKSNLIRKKKILEMRQKELKKKASSKEKTLSNANLRTVSPSDVNAFPVENMDELDRISTEESLKMHLSNIKRKENKILSEESMLEREKIAHIRDLKRVANEDASRFKSHPKLHDRYILFNLLGKGGFSEVWRAYDIVEFRQVAVKIHQLDPRWSEAKKDNYTKHVSREYEIHRNVRHPRIVSLYDVFEIDSNSFATVLECCEGTDLDTMLKDQRFLQEKDSRALLLQILSGMRYLSQSSVDGSRQGIIHYDLKPGNILFDEFGDAKITDFGLSKIVDTVDSGNSMELTSQGAGTYWYLPPECFITHESVRISNKVDVWSIGVIYYQMLYGRRPFGHGMSQDRILSDHTMLNAREVQFPEKPQVSEEAKKFIQKCLTYDQAMRPTISELCNEPYLYLKKL